MKEENKQKTIFLKNEGDAWFERNRMASNNPGKKISTDPILKLLHELDIDINNILEIGASNGWRLSALENKNRKLFAIEPSSKAIDEGKKRYPNINFTKSTADNIPLADDSIDLLIYGFCLYLCDRDDLFKIIYEADRVLVDNGSIVIHDFIANEPMFNKYKHTDGVNSYKLDYSSLFTSNPYYKLIKKVDINENECVWIVKKSKKTVYLNEKIGE